MNDQTVMREEKAYLQTVLKSLREEMLEIDRRFSRGVSAADEAAEESVRQMLENRYRMLVKSQGAPYFAHIDFTQSKQPKETVYIGKTSVYDRESGLLVTDWRAPVSALYYDNRLGAAVYQSPDGAVEGELTLKRRLTVENGDLLGYDDIDVTATDEMLAPYLSVSTDTRLKNIIATIQSGQNSIIRADSHRPLIVQGAAGSGKTTVALHRIAYLAYNLGKSFRPEQFLVLSSGGFFLRYISGILPDLGVEDVPQLAFEELVRRYVRSPVRIWDPADRTGGNDGYKSSYEILSDIDSFLAADAELFSKRTNALAVYKRFLEQTPCGGLTKNMLEYSDLAPLLYVRIRMAGLSDVRVRHVVIDEAQDFSPMQLTVLQTLFKKASFTILGDMAQGIYPHGMTGTWEEVNRQVWQGGASVLMLQKSYRATMEIMEAAGKVIAALPEVPTGEAVVRRGEAVTYTDVWGMEDRAAACVRAVEKRLSQGHKNIAVIMSHPSVTHSFAGLLKLPDCRVVTSRDGQYEGGVCLLPAALSKGLEFDSVIVADAERYPKDPLGIKLLYVAMTRAMHTLDVIGEFEDTVK